MHLLPTLEFVREFGTLCRKLPMAKQAPIIWEGLWSDGVLNIYIFVFRYFKNSAIKKQIRVA